VNLRIVLVADSLKKAAAVEDPSDGQIASLLRHLRPSMFWGLVP
jgi:hypothetical protein